MTRRTVLYRYINGNYQITLYSDGTKVRTTPDKYFEPLFPETIDINISENCPHKCPFCYISATPNGKHGNLNLPIFNTISQGTEIAINYADHPDLNGFLKRMRNYRVIVNLTVNCKDFTIFKRARHIAQLIDNGLIYGLGVSIQSYNDYTSIPKYIKDYEHTVLHVINGIVKPTTFQFIAEEYNKILILGYKQKGRGLNYKPNNDLSSVLSTAISENRSIVSFDNLALEQLNVKNLVDGSVWENNYMGKEGQFSMYIDTVSETVNKSSTEPQSSSKQLADTIIDNFSLIKDKLD